MTKPPRPHGPLAFALLPLAACLTACSSGDNARPGTPAAFTVVDVSLDEGGTQPVTKPILIQFSGDVDFSSVSATTIQITDDEGAPALGSFSLASPQTVRFQPSCPSGDEGHAGLRPATSYRLAVAGGTGLGVQSTAGVRLRTSRAYDFLTSSSLEREDLYHDPLDTPPKPVLLGAEE
ncbi:MAG: Ig-like domain-containing protein, partial [Planctomycetota bacterium]